MQDLQQSQNIPPYTQTDLTQTLLSVTHNILPMTIFIIDQHGTTNISKYYQITYSNTFKQDIIISIDNMNNINEILHTQHHKSTNNNLESHITLLFTTHNYQLTKNIRNNR